METLKFNSTIKCSGCLERVTPFLNETAGTQNWEVDLRNPNKVLTVKANDISPEQIAEAVEKAGYTVEPIK